MAIRIVPILADYCNIETYLQAPIRALVIVLSMYLVVLDLVVLVVLSVVIVVVFNTRGVCNVTAGRGISIWVCGRAELGITAHPSKQIHIPTYPASLVRRRWLLKAVIPCILLPVEGST